MGFLKQSYIYLHLPHSLIRSASKATPANFNLTFYTTNAQNDTHEGHSFCKRITYNRVIIF